MCLGGCPGDPGLVLLPALGCDMPGTQRLGWGCFLGCLCQASVSLSAAVWNGCPSPGTQLGFLS